MPSATKQQLINSAYSSVSQLSRSFSQLMRQQMSCGPITVQQCYTLEALIDGPRSMKSLAAAVGLHQSTLTRVVEKLERQGYLRRTRDVEDQRSVAVEITNAGATLHTRLHDESQRLIGLLFDRIPKNEQRSVVDGLAVLANLLEPDSGAFAELLNCCCADVTSQSKDDAA